MKNISNKNLGLWIVIAIVFFYAMGMTIVLPLLPFLLGKYMPESQIVIGLSLLVSVYSLCQFISAPIFGALSDYLGRKPVLIASLIGSVIGYVLFGIGGALWMLFLGRIIDGLTAGDMGSLVSYIADSTKPKERTKWFGYVGAAAGLGMIFGPAIGGLLGTISITLPFFVTAGIFLVLMICTQFFLPESLPIEKRKKNFSIKQLNVFSHYKEILMIREVRRLIIVGAFFTIALTIYQINFSIFLKDVFSFGPAYVGGILTLIGACDIISRAVLLPRLLKKFSENSLSYIGLAGLITGMSLIFISAYVLSPILLVIAVITLVIGEGLFDPTFNSRLSSTVNENKQGQLQGVNQSLQSIYLTIVPLVTAGIYLYSPSAIFALAAVLFAIALIILIKITKNVALLKNE